MCNFTFKQFNFKSQLIQQKKSFLKNVCTFFWNKIKYIIMSYHITLHFLLYIQEWHIYFLLINRFCSDKNQRKIANISIYYNAYLKLLYIPDWKTYLAKDCIRVAGHVGGAVSSTSRLNRKVSSKPNPEIPSGPDISCTLPSPCKSERPKLCTKNEKNALVQNLFAFFQVKITLCNASVVECFHEVCRDLRT